MILLIVACSSDFSAASEAMAAQRLAAAIISFAVAVLGNPNILISAPLMFLLIGAGQRQELRE
jgi:hypothetical protein